MTTLRQQRCWNHGAREAIARCPSCGHFFCRECITEHEERIICAACLRQQQAAPVERPRRSFARVGRAVAAMLGVFMAWFFFYLVGRVLVSVPVKYHEGTLWKAKVEEEIDREEAP